MLRVSRAVLALDLAATVALAGYHFTETLAADVDRDGRRVVVEGGWEAALETREAAVQVGLVRSQGGTLRLE